MTKVCNSINKGERLTKEQDMGMTVRSLRLREANQLSFGSIKSSTMTTSKVLATADHDPLYSTWVEIGVILSVSPQNCSLSVVTLWTLSLGIIGIPWLASNPITGVLPSPPVQGANFPHIPS